VLRAHRAGRPSGAIITTRCVLGLAGHPTQQDLAGVTFEIERIDLWLAGQCDRKGERHELWNIKARAGTLDRSWAKKRSAPGISDAHIAKLDTVGVCPEHACGQDLGRLLSDIQRQRTRHVNTSWLLDMTNATTVSIVQYLAQSRDAIQAALDNSAFLMTTGAIVDRMADALAAGRKILLAGNGGSAADAQHLAGEFVARFNYDRAPVAAIALTTDSSVLTAIGNDYGYDRVFERQVLGLGVPGDVFIAISTSGRSPNILHAIDAARRKGLVVVGFTGRTGGQMAKGCDLCLYAPADTTPLVQQLHITAGHIICGLVEERLFPQPERLADSA
jgi:D-sedoheptulose 7-phosphate isomerase